ALTLPAVTQRFDLATAWKQYTSTLRVETSAILRSLPFIIILLLGVLNTLGNAIGRSAAFGTSVYPVTHLMVSAINGGFVLFAIMTFFAHIITNNRNVGYLVALLYFISLSVLGALHFEHRLYQVFNLPDIRYSDMNGFGHFLSQHLWFMLYWLLFAAILLV